MPLTRALDEGTDKAQFLRWLRNDILASLAITDEDISAICQRWIKHKIARIQTGTEAKEVLLYRMGGGR